MGYLSGSSPQLKSGTVSALSVLVYQDVDICLSIPFNFIFAAHQSGGSDKSECSLNCSLIQSVVTIFLSMLVDCIFSSCFGLFESMLTKQDLHSLFSDVVYEVQPWSLSPDIILDQRHMQI